MRSPWFRHVLCSAALVFGLAAPVMAQTAATGNIEGVATDATGAVLPGVTVTIRNLDTNVSREVITDGSGRYRAAALQPGRYQVSATLSGFEIKPVSDVPVTVGQTVPVDLKMHTAGIAEDVVVTAQSPVIDTRRTDVSNVIGEQAIENLPMNGRRWDNFVLLSPGVTNDGNFGLVSYRGISGLYNNNMVDGVDNNQAFFSEARGRTRIAYAISQTAIKEFQVGVSNMSAEFGRAAGGTVNAVTKSGTNTFSGEGFYFLRDKAFQAINPKVPLVNGEKPDERRQQFGFAAGGPIEKDKVFFFGNYDQQLRNFPIFATPGSTTFLTSACTAPAANCAATLAFFQGLNILSPREGNNKVGLAKVDVTVDNSNTLSLSINSHRWRSPNGVQTQPTVNLAESMNGTDIVKSDFFVGSLNTIVSQRTLNELRVQIGRDYEEQQPNSTGPGTTFTSSAGIGFGMPNFLPRFAYPHEQRYEILDAVTYYRGGHSIKAGLDLNYVKENLKNLFNGGGVYNYANFNSVALDCPKGSSGCTAAPTAPIGQHYSTYAQAFDLNNLGGELAFNQLNQNYYVQDSWRVSNELLVNLGLRYEYQYVPQPSDVKVANVVFAGNPGYPLTQHFAQDKNNWGPRLGVTYDFGGGHDTILRAGYGVFYGLTSNSAIANALTNNAVNQATYSLTPSSAGAPVYPNVLTAPPTAPGTKPDLNVLSGDLQRPTIQMADLTLERRVAGNTTVSASYLYSRGTNLPIFIDTNVPAPNAQVTYMVEGQNVGTFPFYRGARPDANVNRILMLQSVVASKYNALVLAANKRFSDGLLFNVHYTLGKSTDNGQNSTTFFASFNQTYDPLNRTLAMEGPSDFDRRHRFVGSLYYRPAYLYGIGVSTIITAESGFPITANISGSIPAGTGAVNTATTNGSGGANLAPWLGRNSERQNGRKTVDLRASKQFGVGGGRKVEVLWEVFNLFNWVNYTGASSTAFNVATTPAATYDATTNTATVNLTRNTGFLVPTTIGNTLYGMRDMQLGLKFGW
jgi:Carboxypeptidase regulatory-like domain